MSKTDQLKACMSAGDRKGALRIAKDFRLGLTPEQRKTLSLGYEAMVHPNFYWQLGKDVPALIASSVALLKDLYMKEVA